jgi:hypothetical protein
MSVLINPYCKLSELKTFLALPLNLADKDDQLIDAINTASRFIEDETYDRFYKQTFTEALVNFQSAGRNNFTIFHPVQRRNDPQYGFIKTPYKPILSLSEIKTSQEYPPNNFGVLTENVDYSVDYANGKIYRMNESAWSQMPGAIKITCDLGFDNGSNNYTVGLTGYDNSIPADTIPGLIRNLCVKLAAVTTGMWRRDVYDKWTGTKSVINVMENDEKWIMQLRHWRMRR